MTTSSEATLSSEAEFPYDRTAASRILAELAHAGLFGPSGVTAGEAQVRYTRFAMTPEPGRVLTYSQRLYLERFMRPCPPEMVTSATHRIMWTDTSGLPNTAHVMADGLGPVVPVVARETLLSLWRDLGASGSFADAVADLDDDDRAVLAGTTTDHEPMEIFRIGIEATGRALVQHALLAHQTPYRTPASFAAAMRHANLFGAVATQWFWELQASTYRRGMIPAALTVTSNGTLRYTGDTVAMLKKMKETTTADAHAVMRRATSQEGLSPNAAVQKYHHELDLISKQYALLDEGTKPRCLAYMSHVVDDERFSVHAVVVDRFVARFLELLETVQVVEEPAEPVEDTAGDVAEERLFHVPDMNCRHCETTIRGVLESMGISVVELDLTSKRVVAEFRTTRNRRRAFEALRDGGYTPVAEDWS